MFRGEVRRDPRDGKPMSDTRSSDRHDLSSELGDSSRASDPADRYGELEAVVGRAVDLGLADDISVTEIRDGVRTVRASSSTAAQELDELQDALAEGPCWIASAPGDDDIVIADEVADDARWPRWGVVAAQRGYRSSLSVALRSVSCDPIGVVTLFRREPHQHATADLDAAQAIADHASVALARGRRDEDLWRAIDARHLIGIAQGFLMHRFDISVEQSFDLLRRISQDTNTKLHAVAAAIVETRTVPGADPSDGPG